MEGNPSAAPPGLWGRAWPAGAEPFWLEGGMSVAGCGTLWEQVGGGQEPLID